MARAMNSYQAGQPNDLKEANKTYPPLDFGVFSWLNNFKLHASEIQKDEIDYDLVIVAARDSDLDVKSPCSDGFKDCFQLLRQHKAADKGFDSEICFLLVNSMTSPSNRMIHSPIGPLNRDYDDVRQFEDAIYKAVQRALKAGTKKCLVTIPASDNIPVSDGPILKSNPNYLHYDLVSLLAAYSSVYVPLELREAEVKKFSPLELNIGSFNGILDLNILPIAKAIESGRIVCRDIGGSDPERMAPPMVAAYVQQVFQGTSIKVEVLKDENEIKQQYPLLSAVDRAASEIPRHRARVITLTYEPEGPYEKTIALVGKGITYDTGGADLKVGGAMVGMHRDKCGAAAVAGFFKVLEQLKPKGIKVIGMMCMARNSIGPNSYVADEIITSRFGRRIRIVNTDAEGRMVMADVLCHMKEKVLHEKDVEIYTIATLTGHACLTCGDGYSIVVPNGPASEANLHTKLYQAGHVMGDPFEISTLRREDYLFIKGKSIYEDLMQCNAAPSSKTERGHQFPAAFLIEASGLSEHGINSSKPLKYCHLDIAASSGLFPGVPTGAPIPALVKHYVLPNL